MPIYSAINRLKSSAPLTLHQAQSFIDSLSAKQQMQIIAAIYIGRDHFHSNHWNEATMLSTDAIGHIPKDDYAHIVHEKSSALINYLDSIERCARNEKFDLNLL